MIPRNFSLIARVGFILMGLFSVSSVWAQGLSQADHSSAPATMQEPLEVAFGIAIDQITFVDQKSENYGAVITLRAFWNDPNLTFDPDEYGRDYKVMRTKDFIEVAHALPTIAPGFLIDNQQAKRWIQNALVVIRPNGDTRYLERSTVTLQAPHFDFTRYPFDRQKFYLDIVSVLPSDLVQYTVLDEYSGLGKKLGEEEWILENASVKVSTGIGLSGLESAKISLGFEGHRHVLYYAIRIFLPMLVLVVVSWTVFFLDEYRKRIEIAGANLLVFVAFNWVISDDLPRLGYLTFLDFILQWMFVVTGAIIAFSVGLSRLKSAGREGLARRLDNYAIKWVYPMGYAAIVFFAVYRYLIVS